MRNYRNERGFHAVSFAVVRFLKSLGCNDVHLLNLSRVRRVSEGGHSDILPVNETRTVPRTAGTQQPMETLSKTRDRFIVPLDRVQPYVCYATPFAK